MWIVPQSADAVVKGIDVNTLLEENYKNRQFCEKHGWKCCTYIIEPQQIAVILCFNSNVMIWCRKQIRQYIETINNELIQACNISLYYGIGNLYGSLSDVSLSFFEAKVALHQFDFTGNRTMIGIRIYLCPAITIDGCGKNTCKHGRAGLR